MICTEAQESVTCDFIKIRLKRRIATRSGKETQPLNVKTAVERPILKLRLQKFGGNVGKAYITEILFLRF